jgi:hypothetical protein
MVNKHIVFTAVLIFFRQFVFAGECLDDFDNYLKALDSLQIDDQNALYPLNCFTLGLFFEYQKVTCERKPRPYVGSGIKNDTVAIKLIKIFPKYLASNNPQIRHSAADALAYYG